MTLPPRWREYKERDVDAEVCQPISGGQPAEGRVRVYDLPAVETMACVIHHGPFTTIGEAYTALTKWSEANGHRVVGLGREVYLQPPALGGDQNAPNTVSEMQDWLCWRARLARWHGIRWANRSRSRSNPKHSWPSSASFSTG